MDTPLKTPELRQDVPCAFHAAHGSALPVVVGGTWCGDCPHLKPYGKESDLTARCALKGVELDWYDYWLAVCAVGEEQNKQPK